MDKENKESAYIYNPSLYNDLFIKSGAIELYTSGEMRLGDIFINGSNSKISTSSWEINKEAASFNHIVAKGGTIENVVFEN